MQMFSQITNVACDQPEDQMVSWLSSPVTWAGMCRYRVTLPDLRANKRQASTQSQWAVQSGRTWICDIQAVKSSSSLSCPLGLGLLYHQNTKRKLWACNCFVVVWAFWRLGPKLHKSSALFKYFPASLVFIRKHKYKFAFTFHLPFERMSQSVWHMGWVPELGCSWTGGDGKKVQSKM